MTCPLRASRHTLLWAALLLAGTACGPLQPPAPTRTNGPATTTPAPAASAAPATATARQGAPVPATPEPATPALMSTPTNAPSLRQLTRGGCCVQPFWSPDGAQVLFLDRPAPEAPVGLWGVDVTGGEPRLVTDKLGLYSTDMRLRAFLQSGRTTVERLSDGVRWTIPNNGRMPYFSPDGEWLAWNAGESGPPDDTARRQVWVSRVDGSQAQRLIDLTGGSMQAWLPDGRLLVSQRMQSPASGQALFALALQGENAGELVELARGQRLRAITISPQGSWLAYVVAFSGDPAQDGLWLLHLSSGERRRLDLFGSFRWRDDQRLLLVPLDLSQPPHRLLQIEAASGQVIDLTDPALTSFKIANGDWSVSPDGRRLVFVSAQDQNIWLLELAP
ncbi:MAG: hypothetical protein AB1894_14240 [Chloroflexota bacterium]